MTIVWCKYHWVKRIEFQARDFRSRLLGCLVRSQCTICRFQRAPAIWCVSLIDSNSQNLPLHTTSCTPVKSGRSRSESCLSMNYVITFGCLERSCKEAIKEAKCTPTVTLFLVAPWYSLPENCLRRSTKWFREKVLIFRDRRTYFWKWRFSLPTRV